MQKLFERILEILGKPLDDPSFERLVQSLGERPEVLVDDASGIVYLFRQSGLQFTFFYHHNCFSSIFFHFGSAMAEAGGVARYVGDLPAGISFGDSRVDVEHKLGKKPSMSKVHSTPLPNAPKDIWEEYEMETFRFRFIFRGSSDKLSSMSIEIPEMG